MKDERKRPEHFPASQPEEHKISRREMAKFACLGAAACACAATIRPVLLPSPEDAPPVVVAREGDLAPGESKLFRYPTENHPAILIRLTSGEHLAYSQSCTHLMCPIYFDAQKDQFVCPCHKGYFDSRDGSVIAGPPPKPLPSFPVAIKDGTIVVG